MEDTIKSAEEVPSDINKPSPVTLPVHSFSSGSGVFNTPTYTPTDPPSTIFASTSPNVNVFGSVASGHDSVHLITEDTEVYVSPAPRRQGQARSPVPATDSGADATTTTVGLNTSRFGSNAGSRRGSLNKTSPQTTGGNDIDAIYGLYGTKVTIKQKAKPAGEVAEEVPKPVEKAVAAAAIVAEPPPVVVETAVAAVVKEADAPAPVEAPAPVDVPAPVDIPAAVDVPTPAVDVPVVVVEPEVVDEDSDDEVSVDSEVEVVGSAVGGLTLTLKTEDELIDELVDDLTQADEVSTVHNGDEEVEGEDLDESLESDGEDNIIPQTEEEEEAEENIAASISLASPILTTDHSAPSFPSPFVARVSTFIVDKREKVHEAEYDEKIPVADIKAAQLLYFNLKKAGGQDRKIQAARRRVTKSVTSIPSDSPLNLEMANKHRPDFQDMVPFQSVEAHMGAIWVMSFSPDGEYLATGGMDATVCVWKITAEAQIEDPVNATTTLRRPSYTQTHSQRGSISAPNTSTNMTSSDPLAHVETASEGDSPAPLSDESSPTVDVSSEAEGVQKWLTLSKPAPTGPLEDWEKALNRPPPPAPVVKKHKQMALHLFPHTPASKLKGQVGDITALDWTSDGRLLSASLGGSVHVWEPEEGLVAASLPNACVRKFVFPGSLLALAAHPQRGNYFVCGGADKVLRVFNISSCCLAFTKSLPGRITALSFTEGGDTLAIGMHNGAVQIREARNMSLKFTLDASASVTGFCFRRADSEMIVGCNNSKIRLYKVTGDGGSTSSGETKLFMASDMDRVAKIKGVSTEGLHVAPGLSEDERFIISGCEEGRVYVWDSVGNDMGFERWEVKNDSTLCSCTSARFVPQKSIERCTDQLGLSTPSAQAAAASALKAITKVSPPVNTKPPPKSSALRSNLPVPKAKPVAEPISNGMQRATAYGRAHPDAQRLRQLGAINQQNMDQAAAVAAGTVPFDGKSSAEGTQGLKRVGSGGNLKAGSLHVQQGLRTSSAMLEGYKKVNAAGGSHVPANAMVIASDLIGNIHIYSKKPLHDEWTAAVSESLNPNSGNLSNAGSRRGSLGIQGGSRRTSLGATPTLPSGGSGVFDD